MSDYIPGDGLSRVLVLRDSSKPGQATELGGFKAAVVGIITAEDAEGNVAKTRDGFLQPRNWHEAQSPQPLVPELPALPDRRYSVSLISDYQNGFTGFKVQAPNTAPIGSNPFVPATWSHPEQPGPANQPGAPAGAPSKPGDPANPFLSDWDWKQKSTRIVDYLDPKGRTALFAQLCRVVDDLDGEYTAAIPLGRRIGGHNSAAAGYVWDDAENRCGLLDTAVCTNVADMFGAGREGTQSGILGIRTDAHFEWNGGAGSQHGAVHFDTTDITNYINGTDGVPHKSTVAWDPTVANTNTTNFHEAGHWRPWFRMKYFRPETPKTTIIPQDPYIPNLPFQPLAPVTTGGNGLMTEMPMGGNTIEGTPPSYANVPFPKIVSYMTAYRNTAGMNTLVMAQQVAAEAISWQMALPNTTIGIGAPPTVTSLIVYGGASIPGAGTKSEILGAGAAAAGTNGLALGNGASAGHKGVAVGESAATTADGDFVFGSQTTPASVVHFGAGLGAYGTTSHVKLAQTLVSGTDRSGNDWTHETGRSTGKAAGGVFRVAVSPPAVSSGSTPNAATTRFYVGDAGMQVFDRSGSTTILQCTNSSGNKIGLFGSAGTTQQTITGSKGGNAALASLLTALASHGLIVDSST